METSNSAFSEDDDSFQSRPSTFRNPYKTRTKQHDNATKKASKANNIKTWGFVLFAFAVFCLVIGFYWHGQTVKTMGKIIGFFLLAVIAGGYWKRRRLIYGKNTKKSSSSSSSSSS
jgi:uncharacterized membrane protein YgcG